MNASEPAAKPNKLHLHSLSQTRRMSRDRLSDRRCDENTNHFNNEKAMPELQTLASGAIFSWQKVWHPTVADFTRLAVKFLLIHTMFYGNDLEDSQCKITPETQFLDILESWPKKGSSVFFLAFSNKNNKINFCCSLGFSGNICLAIEKF